MGLAAHPYKKGKESRGNGVAKVPEEYPRQNKGKKPKNGTVRKTDDTSEIASLSCVITANLRREFPHCGGCLTELIIHDRDSGEDAVIMCPKSPQRLKGRCDADWARVPSRLAKKCDGRGSAAVDVEKEKEKAD